MRNPISLGYLQPEMSRIRADSPDVRYGGKPIASNGTARDWHYLTDITVEWHLHVDLDGLLKDCGLTRAARIGGLLTWRSARTNLRGAGTVADLVAGPNRLTLFLAGTDLGGTVTIEARAILRDTDAGAEPLAPRRPGSLLWHTTDRVVLEGSGGRFPTTVSDFAASGLPGGETGLWYLQVTDSDLQASATRSMRLHLNKEHSDIRDMLEQPEGDKGVQLLRHLRYDTERQLLAVALGNDEFDDRFDYGRGTLGDVLVTVLRINFPNRTLDQLRGEYRMRAGEIEAELLASVWKGTR
jgi:hypothetical protein